MKSRLSLNSWIIIFLIMLNLTSCTTCNEIGLKDEQKSAVEGRIIDVGGNPLANYPIQIRAAQSADESFTNYQQTQLPYEYEVLNEITTDAQGRFLVYFPGTTWVEYIVGAEGDILQFNYNNSPINSPYKIINLHLNYENVGDLKVVAN